MCNMRMIFAGTLATWASEPNGLSHTRCLICVHHISQSRHQLYQQTVQLWFQYFCSDRHELTAPPLVSSGDTADFVRTRFSRSCWFLGRCPLCLARPSSLAERRGRDTVHALHTTLMAASHTAHCDFTREPVQMRLRLAIAPWSRRFHQSPARRGRQQTT